MTTKPALVDTTPAGVYEICEAKRLKAAYKLVEYSSEGGDVDEEYILEVLDALGDKIDEAEKAIEAASKAIESTANANKSVR